MVLVLTGQNLSWAMSLKPRAAGQMPRALRSLKVELTSLCVSLSHFVNWNPAREGQIWPSSTHCCMGAGEDGRWQKSMEGATPHTQSDQGSMMERLSHPLFCGRGWLMAKLQVTDFCPGRQHIPTLEVGSTLALQESVKH